MLICGLGIWVLSKNNGGDRMLNVWLGMAFIGIAAIIILPKNSSIGLGSFNSNIPNDRKIQNIDTQKEKQINSIFSKKMKQYHDKAYGISNNKIDSSFNWTISIDEIKYIDRTLNVEVNGAFITLFDEEKTSVGKSIQKFASEIISSEINENPLSVKKSVDIVFKFNGQLVGQTYLKNNNDFEWEEIQQ